MTTTEHLFAAANFVAMIGWILLIVAPRRQVTERLVLSGLLSLGLAALYLVLIVVFFPGRSGGFGSITEVRTLFSNDGLLLAGWVHYLAFDLFVGAFEVKQAREAGINHWIMVPILFLTFMLGPIGLLTFYVVKSVHARRVDGLFT